ncbi:hypothetical protein BXZ70DRAFT_927079 [Cristinia sonorae]|uniref:Uncharacterized protein n=1 Tax=Cristinia sonorae TaxID=1940300 RepID=A0A8K0XRT6_9AGAR|nr:hypothetical protein BXZ70DRAFT_927079 [Cristinia sonorae]
MPVVTLFVLSAVALQYRHKRCACLSSVRLLSFTGCRGPPRDVDRRTTRSYPASHFRSRYHNGPWHALLTLECHEWMSRSESAVLRYHKYSLQLSPSSQLLNCLTSPSKKAYSTQHDGLPCCVEWSLCDTDRLVDMWATCRSFVGQPEATATTSSSSSDDDML